MPRRPLTELLNTDDPAWPLVQQWIAEATNLVEVLPAPSDAGAQLEAAQVTLRSPMGAVVYHTGGLLIDHGWVRVLGGGGHPRMQRSLMAWNQGRSFDKDGNTQGFLLVGDDAIGGFFAINGGSLGPDVKNVYYFAPDTLRWESLERGYSDWLSFLLGGDLNHFYEPYRWPGWESETSQLSGDQAWGIYPFLWSKEGKDIAKAHRAPVPVEETYGLNMIDFPRQLGEST